MSYIYIRDVNEIRIFVSKLLRLAGVYVIFLRNRLRSIAVLHPRDYFTERRKLRVVHETEKQDERVNTFARNVITEVLSRKLERTRGLNELEFDVRVGIHSSLRHTYR